MQLSSIDSTAALLQHITALAVAALAAARPGPRVVRFGGLSLGGVGVDGAYIYPPPQPAAA